jgi:hypothetical protein
MISCFFIFIIIFMCLGVFGEVEIKKLFWPTFISLIPKNIYDVYHHIFTITSYGLILTIIYPFILLMIAIIRKKKGTEMF